LTENTFSFTAMTWGIVTGERRGRNEPIVSTFMETRKVQRERRGREERRMQEEKEDRGRIWVAYF
jgi:hypothetical protein